jgi:hypothetical protein
MALTDFTNFETVRGVLGVAETEVEDDHLALPVFEQEVLWALDELNLTIRTQYKLCVDAGSGATLLQKQFIELVRVHAAYTVAAKLLGGSIELFAPKVITDGKGKQERVEDPFSNLRNDVALSLGVWAKRLLSVLNKLDPTQVVTTAETAIYMSAAGLAVDPVVGA